MLINFFVGMAAINLKSFAHFIAFYRRGTTGDAPCIVRLSERPTVSLDVMSLVASSCGYHRGQIEQPAAVVRRNYV
jgi:hypothetical protein